MEMILVDALTAARFARVERRVEIRDGAERVLGWFEPNLDLHAKGYYVPPLSEEELRASEKEPARGLGEILKDLEKRE